MCIRWAPACHVLEDSDNAYVHSLPFGTGGESGPTRATRMGNHPGNPSEKHLVEMDQAEQGIAEAFARTFGTSVVIPHDPPRQRLTATWLAVDGCNPADTMTIPS